ncbi:CHAT domain-containing protein [Dactylosporangium sp. NPDC050588]|uniref:CHAT domain-containing protein n=1 Tax=Dactylosporangium sp. NPDC050588 TaxID=3157211 RepID=UPI0033E738D9
MTNTTTPRPPAATTHRVPRPVTRDPALLQHGEPTTFDVAYAPLADTLPERTKLLVVSAASDGGRELFRVDLLCPGEPRAQSDADVRIQGRPDFSMADILRQGRWRASYLRLRSWWNDKHHLNLWLDELIAGEDDGAGPARLIVWDFTDYAIPWELYYSQEHDDWLGARVEVVRWTSIHDPLRVARYTAKAGHCTGTVLAVEGDDIVATNAVQLADALAMYGAVPMPTVQQLLARLDDDALRFALILVRCHGLFDEDGNYQLGGMTRDECDEYRMPALRQSNAVVLLNACDSATAERTGRHAYRATSSFAELFLRRGAFSVVATVGPVAFDHSHEFAARLLEVPDEDQRLGTVLLEHRRHAADGALRRPGEPDLREEHDFEYFFQSFAYVHFGHPDTVLRLHPEPIGGHDG